MDTLVTHLRCIGLAVADFDVERAFLRDVWGLTEIAAGGDIAYFAAKRSSEHHVLRLRRAADRRTDVIAFAARDRAAVDHIADRVERHGGRLLHPARGREGAGGGYGVCFFDVDGRMVEVSSDVATRSIEAIVAKDALPLGLSHVVFHTPNVQRTVAFYDAALGLRVSDWIDDFMCFMRANRTHHCIGFLPGPAALNHVAFETANADSMMRAMGRMLRANIKLQWGPGRHTAGDNTFAYFVTPAGNILEYTAELAVVDDENWVPQIYPRLPEIIDQWGTGGIAGQPHHQPLADPGLWESQTALNLDMQVEWTR